MKCTNDSAEVAPFDPIVFDSYYRPQIWGGQGLKTRLGRELPDDKAYGEAWDISPLALHTSRVRDGAYVSRNLNDLWDNCREALVGNCGLKQFPFLVKWLECRELLSLQVHPNDQIAQRVLNQPFGKTEAWVVIFAEPTARVFAGLKPGVTRTDVISHLKAGTLQECLHSFVPRAGDCISLPAGTIHAAGGGLMIAEIQQSSDATFRLFDWNRKGLDGKPRALHIDQALDSIDWNQGPVAPVVPVEISTATDGVTAEQLVDGPAFRLERYNIQSTFSIPNAGEFTLWMVLGGSGNLSNPSSGYCREFRMGETVVIPAAARTVTWETSHKESPLNLLCARFPKSDT